MLEAWAAAAAADEESPEEEEENPPGQLLSSVPENERRGVAARAPDPASVGGEGDARRGGMGSVPCIDPASDPGTPEGGRPVTREHGAALWWATSWSEQRGMAMWEGARKIVSRRREKIDPLFDCLNAAFPELGLDRAILTHNWAGLEDRGGRARAQGDGVLLVRGKWAGGKSDWGGRSWSSALNEGGGTCRGGSG